MVVLFAHWHAPEGPSNPATLSVTTQPGSKSDPDRDAEDTTALGNNNGGRVDSGGGAAGALPEHGLGTGTWTEALEREGGGVGEAVRCRSLDLSRSSGRGLERTHRRTCHQEYQRIVIIAIMCPFFYAFRVAVIYYTTHDPSTM